MENCELLDERMAAAFLTVDWRTLQAWRLRGTGPVFLKVGRCVRYAKKDLESYLESARRKSTSDVQAV